MDSEQHQKRHIRAIDGLHGAIHRQPMGAALDSAALPERSWFWDVLPLGSRCPLGHWIGLRENLQETMVFTIKYRAFLQIFP